MTRRRRWSSGRSALSKADGCVVVADERSEANLRWAGNTLTTNGVMRCRTLTVISVVDGTAGHRGRGAVERSAVTADELEDAGPGRRAGRPATPGPAEDAQPLVEPDRRPPTSRTRAEETSSAVFAAVRAGARRGVRPGRGRAARAVRLRQPRAGRPRYLGTSTGLRLRHDQPTGQLELNGKSPDYGRSAWVGPVAPGTSRTSTRPRSTRELTQRLGWARARGRAARRAVRDAAAADRGRRPDDLPLRVGGGPGRRRGPDGLLQARRRHPDRRDGSPTLPLTLRSDPRGAGAGVRAVRDRPRRRSAD